MAGIQLDGFAAASPLDLLPLPRAETRGDNSFGKHLRQADSPGQPSRAEAKKLHGGESKSAKGSQDSTPPRDSERPTASEASDNVPTESDSPNPSQPAVEPGKSQTAKSESDAPNEARQGDETAALVGSAIPTAPAPEQEVQGETEVASAGKAALANEELAKSETGAAKKNLAAHEPAATTAIASEAEFANANSETTKLATETESDTSRAKLNADATTVQVAKSSPGRTTTGSAKTTEPGESKANDSEKSDQPANLPAESLVALDPDKSTDRREPKGEQRGTRKEEPTVTPARAADEIAASINSTIPPSAVSPDGGQAKPDEAKAREFDPATRPVQSDGLASPTARLPQHLLARATAEQATAGKPLSEADQARFVQRVARAFQSVAGEEGELRIRLSPPELGSLRLEVKVQGGVISARLETETDAARSLLLENLPALRERLAEQNIRVDQFDVDLMDRQGGGPSSGPAQDQGRHSGDTSDGATRFRLTEEPADAVATRPTRPTSGEGQLNVLV